MKQPLSRFLSRPWLPVLLVPVFFVVHGWQRYFYYLKAETALRVLGYYLLLAAVVFGALSLVLRRWRTAACTSVLLLSLFFLWGYLHSNLQRLFASSFLVKVSVLSILLLLLTGLLTYFFGKRKEEEQKRLLSFASLLFLVYTLVDAGLMLQKAATQDVAKIRNGFSPEALEVKARPDVLLILMDEFPSTRSLEENLHFNNSDIDSFLARQGFSIQAGSHSNYNFTAFSMASMLNMQYLQQVNARDVLNETDYNNALQQIQQNAFTDRLKAAGYRFVNLSIFDMAQSPTQLTINMFPEKARLLTANTYYDKVLKPHVQVWQSPDTNKLWGMEGYSSVLDYNNRVKKMYLEALAANSDRPRFVYLHVVLPHDPFYYDAEGRLLDIAFAKKVTREARTEYYVNNLQVARQWLRELVAATMQRTRGNSIVLVMGDHGYKKSVHDSSLHQHFANLNAVYFPDRDYSGLYDSMTNVNVLKIVSNKIFLQQQPLLPDSSIHLREE